MSDEQVVASLYTVVGAVAAIVAIYYVIYFRRNR